jgi:nucleotide-binding universal stress UspA family protein
MSIKSILAAYSGDAQGSSGLRLALAMAEKYDAHLTGVVWHGPSFIESRYQAYMSDAVLEVITNRDREVVEEIRDDFHKRVAESGRGDRATFLDLRGVNDFRLAEAARGYDITVMGRRAAEVGREHFNARPDVVALKSGRPLILVPHEHMVERLGDRAAVAWDGSRAATRALSDAMHILETKAEVVVLTVGEAPPEGPGDNVMTLLSRHGIPAVRKIVPRHRDGVARTLLDGAREAGADLLVMGAYEHSKFSEDLLGGVTNDIFEHADVPVLMSH